MTRDQVIDLLTVIAVGDRRTVGEADVILWGECVGDLEFGDARDAVVAHFRESTAWLTPAHVRARVAEVRRLRLAAVPDPLPPVDPDSVGAYQASRRILRAAIAGPPDGVRQLGIGAGHGE